MNINTYELYLDEETRHCTIREKESHVYKEETYQQPMAVSRMMEELFSLTERADEYLYLLAFNTKMRLLGIFEVGHGTGNACLADPRGIYIRAVCIGASNIILVHNHPSGCTKPSMEDMRLTTLVKDAGELLGIHLLDHIIVGSEGCASLHEMGMV